MRIQVDQDRCIGAGQCVMTAPDLFDQREDDGTVLLLESAPPRARWVAARDAAALCPSGAIQVEDD